MQYVKQIFHHSWKKEKLLALFPVVQAIQGLSRDRNTKVGALIIDENYTILSEGYNGLPRKVDENPQERHSREAGEKYYWYEHAERNAIYNAIRKHADIRGGHMLLTCDIPCCDCARAIIQSMQKSIIIMSDNRGRTGNNPMWEEHARRSKQMFLEAGVAIFYISDL